jgi:methylmalonyl-CoA/ethylmalonyl-CoA epimerase
MNLHHIGIATNDLLAGIRHHEEFFNIHPVTEIVEDPIQKSLLVLLSGPNMGGTRIELVQPLSDDSPVSNIIQRGMPLYHLCFEVEDIEGTLEKARTRGALVISGPTPAKLFNGRRIAFIYGPDHYVVEFLEMQRSPSSSTAEMP